MISVGLVGQTVVWHGKNFNVAICLDITNVINVKLCMMVLLIELYLFIPLSVTLTTFQSHRNVKCLTENVILLSDEVETS